MSQDGPPYSSTEAYQGMLDSIRKMEAEYDLRCKGGGPPPVVVPKNGKSGSRVRGRSGSSLRNFLTPVADPYAAFRTPAHSLSSHKPLLGWTPAMTKDLYKGLASGAVVIAPAALTLLPAAGIASAAAGFLSAARATSPIWAPQLLRAFAH